MEHALAILGTVLFGLASVLAVRSLLRRGQTGEQGALAVLAGGTLALLAALVLRGVRAGCIPMFTRFDALTGYAVSVSAVYFLTMAHRNTRGVAAVLLPYLTALLACGLTAVGMTGGTPPPAQGVWLALHVAVSYASYAAFSLGSALATVYLIQDRNLKRKSFGVVWERLPPLESLDHLMRRLVGLAFLLLTGSIILGFVLVRRSGGGEAWLTDPKVGATVATWVLLAVLVHMRAHAGRHGRGVAVLTVMGLVLLLFVFLGVHLVADSSHTFLRLRAEGDAP